MSERTLAEVELQLNSDRPKLILACTSYTAEALRQLLDQDQSAVNFTFRSPEILQSLFDQVETGEAVAKFRHPEGDLISVSREQIRNIRTVILGPIKADTFLTELERNGGIADHSGNFAPTMAPLVEAWRNAFRSIGDNNVIENLTFDMTCQQMIDIDHIGRLLQQISTVLYMKRKRTEPTRSLRFVVAGTDDRKRKWLEKALPTV